METVPYKEVFLEAAALRISNELNCQITESDFL